MKSAEVDLSTASTGYMVNDRSGRYKVPTVRMFLKELTKLRMYGSRCITHRKMFPTVVG